jgi:cupin fold WbuC family metalloprotein
VRAVSDAELVGLARQAAGSTRRRRTLDLHGTPEDPVQRFFNALQPGTYVRPHRHAGAERWELFLAVSGAVALLTFDAHGRVSARVEVAAAGSVRAVEVPAGAWHALACLAPDTLLFEVKPGPYRPLTDKDFAPWAPAEGTPEAAALERWYRTAEVGDLVPRGLA